MKKYIGTKQIEAEPMTMGEAYDKGLLQAGRVPNENEKQNEGYRVRYEGGYESWSPKEVFEKAYKPADTFVERLAIELEDLSVKQDKLNDFFGTKTYECLPERKKQLLRAQLGAMLSYGQILLMRTEEEYNLSTLHSQER